jgi:hypothetical protein
MCYERKYTHDAADCIITAAPTNAENAPQRAGTVLRIYILAAKDCCCVQPLQLLYLQVL